jgi:hypothetical protein
MFMKVLTALCAALILGWVSSASAKTIHHPVRHYYHQHPIMLLENNPAATRTYWQMRPIPKPPSDSKSNGTLVTNRRDCFPARREGAGLSVLRYCHARFGLRHSEADYLHG